jgi:hypothetical protein
MMVPHPFISTGTIWDWQPDTEKAYIMVKTKFCLLFTIIPDHWKATRYDFLTVQWNSGRFTILSRR